MTDKDKPLVERLSETERIKKLVLNSGDFGVSLEDLEKQLKIDRRRIGRILKKLDSVEVTKSGYKQKKRAKKK